MNKKQWINSKGLYYYNDIPVVTDKLPVGIYELGFDGFSKEFFLTHISDKFTLPEKVYGIEKGLNTRITQTFKSLDKNFGVLLKGLKGTGKTVLAKQVCNELGLPVILVNTSYGNMGNFINSINQDIIMLFDEFEKTYDKEQQESILTLLDGVFPTKKLFMITCNDKWRVDSHMRNRPGRIYYMLDFKGLDADFIREYCNDNLENKVHIETIVNVGSLFSEFNFDMLKSLVEEMNRYNESPQEALEMLNAKPEFDGGTEYAMKIVHNGKEVKSANRDKFQGNPLQPKGVDVEFDADPDDEDSEYIWKTFKPDALIHVDGRKGEFTFQDNGTTVVLTRIEKVMYRMYDAF